MAIALSVAYTATPLSAGVQAAIYATPQLSAGVNRPAERSYKLIQVTAAAAASPANILANYNARFGALISGRKIFVRVKLINASGVVSQVIDQSIVIT